MSPEQVRGEELDARTDLFSFGLVLYELATGRPAFSGATAPVIADEILNRPPTGPCRVNPELPAKLEDVIGKALEKDRHLRYQSAGEIRTDLARLKRDLDGERAASAVNLAASAPRDDPSRPRSWWKWAGGAAAVALLGAAVYLATVWRAPIDSIAVLPFVNASADPNTEYLTDGITESLINRLSRLPNLAVMSRSSVFRYKGREVDPQTAGRELKVRAVLATRVVRNDDNLSISTELVDVRNNQHLWGQRYDRKLADVISLQDEISRGITNELRLRLDREQEAALTKRYTQNTEAYNAYLKGRYQWNRRTEEGLRSAIVQFQDAIARDPTYALAYAGLGDCYTQLGVWNYVRPRETFPLGKAAAARAIELDDTLAEAHASLARNKIGPDWDWPGARVEFERALQLDPRYGTAHYWYSYYFLAMGDLDRAAREVTLAVELDPLSVNTNAEVGRTLLYQRQYDAAIAQERKTLELEPAASIAHEMLVHAYLATARYAEALDEANKQQKSSLTIAAYAALGDLRSAQRGVLDLIQHSRATYVPAYEIAYAYTALGDTTEAFRWLERAYEDGSLRPDFMRFDPWFDRVRGDERFKALMRRAGLQP